MAETRQDKCKARQDMTRQEKYTARQDKTRQDQTNPD